MPQLQQMLVASRPPRSLSRTTASQATFARRRSTSITGIPAFERSAAAVRSAGVTITPAARMARKVRAHAGSCDSSLLSETRIIW